MNLSFLPSYEGLHPLIVHFPIALLLVAPIAYGVSLLCRGGTRTGIFLTGIILTLGTIGTFAAVETGEATGEYVDKTSQIEELISAHGELGEQTFYTFLGLTGVYWLFYFGSAYIRRKAPRLWWPLTGAYSLAYAVGVLLLVQTAHAGGVLVHQYGVHAPMNNAKADSAHE